MSHLRQLLRLRHPSNVRNVDDADSPRPQGAHAQGDEEGLPGDRFAVGPWESHPVFSTKPEAFLQLQLAKDGVDDEV